MLRLLFVASILFGVAACAASSETPSVSPSSVTITLTSGIAGEPYSAEELANPDIQEIIKQCVTQSGSREGCDIHAEPVDDRSVFDRSVHDSVIAVIKIGGLEPNRSYIIEGRLFNPNGEQISRKTMAAKTTTEWLPHFRLSYRLHWAPLPTKTGTWRIDIFINGQPETSRTFKLTEGELADT